MTPVPYDRTPPVDGARCAACAARLASDQRYCLECGERRGPPLPTVAAYRARLEGRALAGTPANGAAGGGTDAAPGTGSAPARRVRSNSMPGPAAAAVAVLAVLAFGVLLGGVTTVPPIDSLARTLIVAAAPPATVPGAQAGSHSRRVGGGGRGATLPPAPPARAQGHTGSPLQGPSAPAPTGPGAPSGSGSGSPSSSAGSPSSGLLGLPPIKHVFLIVLSDQGYAQSFGTTARHRYLSSTLRGRGELITGYYGIAGSSLADEVALISGQGPTADLENGCPLYSPIVPSGSGRYDQVLGNGCVFPRSTPTLAAQLRRAGLRWKAYVQGMGNGPRGQPSRCRHPALGAADPGQPAAGDPYVTWTNPFVYFASITRAHARACAADDVALARLRLDLRRPATTPAFAYIAPDPCDDGSSTPCAPGRPGGLALADSFLRSIVPEIERSAAFRRNGLIAITFDHAPQTGPYADTSGCCDQPSFANLAGTPAPVPPPAPAPPSSSTPSPTTPTSSTTSSAAPSPGTSSSTATSGTSTAPAPGGSCPPNTGATTPPAPPNPGQTTTAGSTTSSQTTSTPASPAPTTTGPAPSCAPPAGAIPPGGGKVGLLLISRYVKPGSVDAIDSYNHFSLLKSIENLFGLRHLGYARDPALPVLDAATFNAGGR